MTRYSKESEIEAVVNGFENCTTKDFRHTDHLVVAVCYLESNSVAEAIRKMRAGLMRFLDHHGVSQAKYHETLTAFWIELTAAKLGVAAEPGSLVDRCNLVVEELADKDLVLQFYSQELLKSEKARRDFIEPDLKSWRQTNPSQLAGQLTNKHL